MNRALYVAVFLMCFNLGIGLVNSIDDVYSSTSGGNSLFGERQEPYVKYDTLRDANDQNVTLTDPNSIANGTDRWVGYNTQSGVATDASFLISALNGVTTILNFFWRGFLGLPAFLTRFGLNVIFVPYLQLIIGLFYVTGIYSLIRGGGDQDG